MAFNLLSALPVVGDLASGLFSAFSSSDAADEQAKAIKQANRQQERQQYTTRQDLAPWMETGRESLFTLADLLGLGTQPTEADLIQAQTEYDNALQNFERYGRKGRGRKYEIARNELATARSRLQALQRAAETPTEDFGSLLQPFSLQDFEKEPGYQFRLNEGEKAINRAAAARGEFGGGKTMKALLKYGQDYASDEYQDAWNRDAAEKARTYNFLAGPSGLGQTTAAQVANFGQDTSNRIAENYLQGGNVRAAGIIGRANAINQGIKNAYDAYTMGQLLKGIPSSGIVEGEWDWMYDPNYGGPGSAIPGYYG